MAETNRAAFSLSFDDRSIISCENIYVDIESEISLISEYPKDKKKPVVQLLLKEFCQRPIEEVYRKIEENAKKTGRFIPDFSEINICDQTRDAYQKNSMQKKQSIVTSYN